MYKSMLRFCILAFLFQGWNAYGRGLEFDDLLRMRRVSEPAVSPDGLWVAFTQTVHDPETLRLRTDIYMVPLAGGEVRRMTNHPGSDTRPMFTPDGQSLIFISDRSGSNQFHLMSLAGGEPSRITDHPGGVSGGALSSDGRMLLYHADVLVDSASVIYNHKTDSAPQARIIDGLLFRHWQTWRDGTFSHLFAWRISGDQPPLDLTPGKVDVPPISLGSVRDYDFSRDGKSVFYVANRDSVVAISTNNDLWRVSAEGGSPKLLTPNPALDVMTLPGPKGKYLAYQAMERPGFESDRRCLWLLDLETGERANLTAELDRSVSEVVWDPAGNYLYFTGEDQGRISIFRVLARIKAGARVERLTESKTYKGLAISPDGRTLVALQETFDRPAELVAIPSSGGAPRFLTNLNSSVLEGVEMHPAESFWFTAADSARVHGFILKPPGFSPGIRYPVLLMVHGGPQGAWTDEFHYRWNAQMFASWGYVAVLINPRGSTGYGQRFTDQITGDWGGMCFDDLMRGLDWVLDHCEYTDRERVGAAGASFGGYMMNWLEGHTDRFRCLVNHDGVYNLESMYASTEELWFPEWEFHGTPWENPTLYRKWSPHLFASNFKTPMLVIHGDRDYRVPPEQGIMVFTTLRRLGIDSRLVYFTDEGHWVAKPADSRLWYKTIREWLDKYLKP